MQGLPVHLLTSKGNQKLELGSANGKNNNSENSELLVNNGEQGTPAAESFGSLFSGLIKSSDKNSGNSKEAFSNPSLNSALEEMLEKQNGEVKPELISGEGNVRQMPRQLAMNDGEESEVSNLDDLLGTLKSYKKNPGLEAINQSESPEYLEESEASDEHSPLDFLIREGGRKNSNPLSQKDPAQLKNNSKILMSSEDFLMTKDQENVAVKNKLESENFDINKLLTKNHGQAIKNYGQRQEVLNSGLIKSTADLAFGERKTKINHDELKNSELKASHELSMIKESFIPNVQAVNGVDNTELKTPSQVLDLSKINSSNTNEIIKTISNYIEQAQFSNRDSLDLNVRHDSLGEFKIQVNKMNVPGNNQIDLQIVTSTQEGHEFFVKHESGLIKSLTQAGIQLADLKIVSGQEMMAMGKGDSSTGSQSQQHHGQNSREFVGQQSFGDSSNGADRRKNLWEEARAQQQRYGA